MQLIQEAEVVALLHNTLPQAVKSDRALLKTEKLQEYTVQHSQVKIEKTVACTLRVANRDF